MLVVITVSLLYVIMLISLALADTYSQTGLKEIKRRASRGSTSSRGLYHVVRHGRTAIVFLQLIALIAFSSMAVMIASNSKPWVAILGIAVLAESAVLASYLPQRFVGRVAELLAPYYARFLVRARPATNVIARLLRRFTSQPALAKLYETEDLLELLEKQKTAAHNRIEKTELDIALHALSFGQKIVKDYMVPRSVVHFVRAEEPVGPILLNELSDTGFSRFPVRKNEDDDIVGTLYFKDLVEKRTSGIVSNVMSSDVYYAHETDTLEHVLGLFLKTKHHLFIVQNEFSEVVGIITIEDVLEQIIGRRIVDESDVHADMRQVALDKTK